MPSIKKIFRFLLLLAFVFQVLTGVAMNLGTKTIAGRECYYYTVEKKDTDIFRLADQLGITRNDIVKYNPAANDGLKPGMTLYFPVDKFKDAKPRGNEGPVTEHIASKGDTYLSIVKKYNVSSQALLALNPGIENGIKEGRIIRIPSPGSEVMAANAEKPSHSHEIRTETVSLTEQAVADSLPPATGPSELKVVVCMPFMLNDESNDKTALYATDFYRGFLLAVDSLRASYGNPTMKITAVDCDGADRPFAALKENRAAFAEADIIVAPDIAGKLNDLAAFALKNKVYVFNVFQARDTSYVANPYMLQGNIDANTMYGKAADSFIASLNGAVPVFLDNESAKKDKQAFVDMLTVAMTVRGIPYQTLLYDGTLTSSAIASNLPVDGANYVFVPLSASLTEFHKYSSALLNYKTMARESEFMPGDIRLFGYPEFTRFTGDALDKLKAIGTTFYSRFYNDPTNRQTEAIAASYAGRYGTGLPDGVPNQALFGFDVARWLIALAAKGPVTAESIEETVVTDGVQTDYRFQRFGNAGFINDDVLIVTLSESFPPTVRIL